jgi:hypothetical protein
MFFLDLDPFLHIFSTSLFLLEGGREKLREIMSKERDADKREDTILFSYIHTRFVNFCLWMTLTRCLLFLFLKITGRVQEHG